MNRLIGLAEAESSDKTNDIDLREGFHAYVKALVIAEDEYEFSSILENRLEQMGLRLLNCEEVSPISTDEEHNLKEKLAQLDDLNRVVFLTFHAFDPDDGE